MSSKPAQPADPSPGTCLDSKCSDDPDALRQQLQASETRQSAFLQAAFNAIILVDQAGSIVEFNRAAERMFGCSRSEIVGEQLAGLIIPHRYYDAARTGLRRYLKAVRPATMKIPLEVNAVSKYGDEFPVELLITQIKPALGFMYILRDISERKQVEEDLRASEERLRTMAEFMPQKIFTATPEGDVEYCNLQWANYSGRPLQELFGVGWQQLLHRHDIVEHKNRWRNAFASGKPFEHEQRLRRHDGHYHWHITRAHPVHNESGTITAWIGSSTDIDESKRTTQRQQELEVITAGLQEQRRQLLELTEAKDEFILLASHQLRTPATGVKQYIGMLLEGFAGELPPGQREFLEHAYESNERQLTIVDDLLQVARVDSGKVRLHKTRTDLVDLVKDVLGEQAEKFTQRRQRLDFKSSRKKIIATVDKSRLRMVIENLIDNANKYTPEGKSIEVKISKPRQSVRIAIADQGVGIARTDINKIFEKFSRLHNTLSLASGGSGLGLYWAKGIVDLHGGSIVVDSVPDEGSVFTIQLPL